MFGFFPLCFKNSSVEMVLSLRKVDSSGLSFGASRVLALYLRKPDSTVSFRSWGGWGGERGRKGMSVFYVIIYLLAK